MHAALLVLALVSAAEPAPSAGGALTEPTVTSVRYACRVGEVFSPIVRNVEAPVVVTRVIAGERVSYEVYEVQRGSRTVLLATCDRVVTMSP